MYNGDTEKFNIKSKGENHTFICNDKTEILEILDIYQINNS